MIGREFEEIHKIHISQRRRLRVLLKVENDPVLIAKFEALVGFYDDANEEFDNVAHIAAKAI